MLYYIIQKKLTMRIKYYNKYCFKVRNVGSMVRVFFGAFGIGNRHKDMALYWMVVIVGLIYHIQILDEEATCIKKYGESYRGYMKRIPRYFLFL